MRSNAPNLDYGPFLLQNFSLAPPFFTASIWSAFPQKMVVVVQW